jgi:Wadjet anti plasmid transformation system JetA-like protein
VTSAQVSASLPAATTEILRRLLDRYERSRAFGQPGPWRQDVIVRVDAASFPAAFHPDGREELEALHAAAKALERAGAARVVRHRGYAVGVPREVRLGPDELGAAYRLATRGGFEPLADVLAALRSHVERLQKQPLPAWMNAFLARVDAGAAVADLSALGVSRERLKRERRDVEDALTAAAGLALGASGWERVVSERLFGDSKRLAAVRARVVDILVRADPRWDGIPPEDAAGLPEAYGVRPKPGLIRCAGRAALGVAGRTYLLADFTPVAHLPEAWAHAWVDALARAELERVTTIENEFPFFAYVEEAGGPDGLGARGEVAVYTAGFPSPVLVESLAALARRSPALVFQHWGDADLGGLRIWWLLRGRLGRPVHLARTTAAWLTEVAHRGGTPLGEGERAGLERLRREVLALSSAGGTDVAGAVALIDALLSLGVKIEQERY